MLKISPARSVDSARTAVISYDDESKLQRKKPEPIAFTSATGSLGSAVLSGIVSGISGPSKKINDNDFRKDRPWLWCSWEKKEDFK